MKNQDSRTWVEDGEKYALLGLSIKWDDSGEASGSLMPRLTMLTSATFRMPAHWREWLGSIRAEEVEDCDVFFLSRLPSRQPEVLDGENQILQQKVWRFFVGLLLSSTFATAHKPVILTGSREDGDIGVRQIQDLESPVPNDFRPYPAVTLAHVRQAGQIAQQLERASAIAKGPSHWRLFRALHLYTQTRTERDLLQRVHQYTRCVEGLLLCDPGKSRKQFRSRTELFIGGGHHEMMGEIYDMRSKVEHLHEDQYLEPFDRELRLGIMKKEAVIENVARTTLNRILSNEELWPHFANRAGLAAFWALTSQEQREIWGSPVNPLAPLSEFDPRFIDDGLLGG